MRTNTVTRRTECTGFTLMELMLVVAIIGILGGIAVPAYLGYLEKARIARSIAEIRHIEKSIKLFFATSEHYPTSLAELGADNIRDPWGTPYQYFNVMLLAAAEPLQGSPEAAKESASPWLWFIPSTAHATPPPGAGNGNPGNGGNRGKGQQGGGSQTNAQQAPGNSGDNANASGNGASDNSIPSSSVGGARKDRFGAPLNSDFDLYSMGKNRESAASLSTPKSYDDVIRASDGMFVGLASDF